MKHKLASAITVVSFVIMASCNNNPVENKPIAVVGQAVQPSPSKREGAATLIFSDQGSQLGFVGAKVTGKHEGGFGKFSGQITLVDGDVTKSLVRAEIETASLTTDPSKLVEHLKSPDFFDVVRFPKAVFQSTQILSNGDSASFSVSGNLELHGVTKSITFPASIQLTKDDVRVKSEFGINRKDFGIVYPGKPDDLIKDEVLIRLNLVAKKG